ncbi:MAG: hypothetical protein MHM6MM_002142 [Cercozoa sp. M6MM]
MSLFDKTNNIRGVLDTVDRLRDHIAASGDPSVQLPSIAVVGDQSSGKSSVLEALSGVALPRGRGIVTRYFLVLESSGIQTLTQLGYRCPLVLRLVCIQEGQKEYAQLRAAPNGQADEVEASADFEVELSIEEIGTAIAHLTDKVAGDKKGVSARELKLTLYRQGVPDLTLIDLPGITRNPVEEQPEDIYEQVTALIETYITPSSTIILNVMPANVDLSTSESLRMSRRVDPTGERTLAVLTKCDLLEKNRDIKRELEAMLDGDFGKSSVLGCVAVRCRSQSEIEEGVSMDDVRRLEAELFTTRSELKHLQPESKGIPALARLLASLQLRRVQDTMPALARCIKEALDEATAQASSFGREYTSETACRSALTRMILATGEELRCQESSMERLIGPLSELLRSFDLISRGELSKRTADEEVDKELVQSKFNVLQLLSF